MPRCPVGLVRRSPCRMTVLLWELDKLGSANNLRTGSEGFLHLMSDGLEVLEPPLMPQSSFTTQWLWHPAQLLHHLTAGTTPGMTSDDIASHWMKHLLPEACEYCIEPITGCLIPLNSWFAVLKEVQITLTMGYRRPYLRSRTPQGHLPHSKLCFFMSI